MRATRTSARSSPGEIERQRLGRALALVVAGARAGAADPAAIILLLRVHLGIAIDLAGRGEQEARAGLLGQPQQVAACRPRWSASCARDRPDTAAARRRRRDCRCADAIRAARGPRRGSGLDDVRLDEAGNRGWLRSSAQVRGARGLQIVEADDFSAALEQRRAQMRADEAGAAGDQGDSALRCRSSSAASCFLFMRHRRVRRGAIAASARWASSSAARWAAVCAASTRVRAASPSAVASAAGERGDHVVAIGVGEQDLAARHEQAVDAAPSGRR